MEEDPKQHDFDQRHDGPLQRSSIQIDSHAHEHHMTSLPNPVPPAHRGRSSTEIPRSSTDQKSHSVSALKDPNTSSPISPTGRKSTTISRGHGAGRPSADFDRRFDGPYGRPSLTMSRRRSSGNPTSPVAGGAARPSNPEIPIPEHHPSIPDVLDEGSDPNAPSMDTMQSSDPAFEPEPPSLDYTLHTRKRAIAFFWILVIVDSVFMPLGLYYGLWYGLHKKGKMSPNTVFSIVTAALGGISIFEYFIRFWRLYKKNSTCRVIGAHRWYLDWFHWNFTLGWVIIMIELIVGTVPENPPIRLVAMPVPSMLYVFGTELLLMDAYRLLSKPAPVRISSIPKYAQVRPGIYTIIEDIVAVDGSGGTAFREKFNARYEASHTFRAMLRRLGLFWSIGAQGMAVVSTILVFTLQRDAAYAVGWSAPFIWAGFWTLATFWYVKRSLKKEKTAWAEELEAKRADA